MSLTLQRTQNRLAWKAKNRLLCSEDRLLSLQTICTMRINCRWPIHLFRPLWQKWKCYCDSLCAQSSFQVLGSNQKKRWHVFYFLEFNLSKIFWFDSLSLTSRSLSQRLGFKTWHWCALTSSYDGQSTFTFSVHSICCKSVTSLWLKKYFIMM